MDISVIIPVWNGSSVIVQCLDALIRSRDELELICVDNASQDGSAALIAEHYPSVHLIQQPTNTGFAGGVNAGIGVSRGDLLVLLNQDCIVHNGWLEAIIQEIFKHSDTGIAGCQILNPDGTPNHLGARIRHPDAYGIHCTALDEPAQSVEYVTGAAFAVRRDVLNSVGRFDEGFYPAYYEDADYCYRARHRGYKTICVSAAVVTHLRSSCEWQVDSIKYAANQHHARYRFVCKHFAANELSAFFEAEHAALQSEHYFDHTIGRALAARDILRSLTEISHRRAMDLGEIVSTAHYRHLQNGFVSILRNGLQTAIRQSQAPFQSPSLIPPESSEKSTENSLLEREHELLTRLKRLSAATTRQGTRDNIRRVLARGRTILSGERERLLSDLYTIQTQRIAQVERDNHLWRERFIQSVHDRNLEIERVRQLVKVLEIFVDYEY